jgi:hypothetical protein
MKLDREEKWCLVVIVAASAGIVGLIYGAYVMGAQ